MKETIVILDNVRSAHNVGSIFRTADGAGVNKIYLTGITPTPTDRFGREQPEITKTSLGATASVAWEKIGSGEDLATSEIVGLIKKLQTDGCQIVAVEQSSKSISIYQYARSEKVAYIFGAEVEGVQSDLLELADKIIEIPMNGQKESLNVGVSVGVVLYQPDKN